MDLTKFDFPNISTMEMAFSTLKTDKTLLEEAKKRGFYGGNGPYNRLFSDLFYKGGRVSFKKGLDDPFVSKVWRYVKALMRSFEPKHEEKEAICAMLLSELVEEKLITE